MTVASRTAPPVVTRADVERLVRFDGRGARILSLYLDLDPERHVTRSYRIVLEDLEEGLVTAVMDASRSNGPGTCGMCGAETRAIADIVDRAAQLALEQDGDVDFVHEGAGHRLRDACDGMGALLRFRLHA